MKGKSARSPDVSERKASRLSWSLAVGTAALLCVGLFLLAIGPTLSLLEGSPIDPRTTVYLRTTPFETGAL